MGTQSCCITFKGLRNLKNFKVHIIIEEWNTKLENITGVCCVCVREREDRQRHIQKHTIILDNL